RRHEPRPSRTYLQFPLRRIVLERASEHSTYVDPGSGRRCKSRHNLQIEHILPVARGGTNAPENLTVLCGQHNRLRAEEVFGPWVRDARHWKRSTTARR